MLQDAHSAADASVRRFIRYELSRRKSLAGFKVFNKTDQDVWITIYEPLGQQIGYGNVVAGGSHEFTTGAYAIGSQYKLLAEYPTKEPHRWTATTKQYVTKAGYDSIHLMGNSTGGYWQNP